MTELDYAKDLEILTNIAAKVNPHFIAWSNQ